MRLIERPAVQISASTIVLDVHSTPEEQLAHVGRRARRYIRKALNEGVEIREAALNEENFGAMYRLMTTVSGGRGVAGLPAYDYYRHFWRTYQKDGHIRLFFAYEHGQPVVGVLVIVLGDKAVYKDGGSTPGREAKGAAYLLQWHIMNELAKTGVKKYDLWGAPPSDRVNDPAHPFHGIGRFKTAFSKEIIDDIGSVDVVMGERRYVRWERLVFPIVYRIYRRAGLGFW